MNRIRLRKLLGLAALLIAAAAMACTASPEPAPAPAPRPVPAPGHAPEPEHHEGAVCGDPAAPLLVVSDFNADGIVDSLDLAEIRAVVTQPRPYRSLYDRNADGIVDKQDVAIVVGELGFPSASFDREIAQAYHRFSQFQDVEDAGRLRPQYQPYSGALAGHGEHWGNDTAVAAAKGETTASFARAEALNVPDDESGVWAMHWAQAATPMFAGGATDWPTPGGEWQGQRVIAFAGEPPDFTSDPRERWHTHAGLCLFENPAGERELHEQTTYNECQAYEGVNPEGNTWINIWMLHMWLFELNPNGVWGNTHPCLDRSAPSEVEIRDGREAPWFFRELH